MAALPMWIEYMRFALEGIPGSIMDKPPGIVTLHVDPATGAPLPGGGITEDFMVNHPPQRFISRFDGGGASGEGQGVDGGRAPENRDAESAVTEDLF
jgi:penicillin-binding protein 1A